MVEETKAKDLRAVGILLYRADLCGAAVLGLYGSITEEYQTLDSIDRGRHHGSFELKKLAEMWHGERLIDIEEGVYNIIRNIPIKLTKKGKDLQDILLSIKDIPNFKSDPSSVCSPIEKGSGKRRYVVFKE